MKTLLVESDPDRRRRLSEALGQRGHEVTLVADVHAAWAAVEGEVHPLVLVGVDSLPDAGIDVCRRLRAAPGGRQCLLVVLTQRDDPEYLERLLDQGADDYLTLPADGRLLALRLAILERRAGALDRSEPTGDAVVEHLSEARQAEEALREANIHLQRIFDGAVEGILIADAKTRRFLRANRAISRMLGYSEEELLRLSVADIHPPDALPMALDQFERMREGRVRWARDFACVRKDGSVFYADIGAGRVVYQGRDCLLGFFHDVTAQKQAAEALAESEARFRAIFESAALGIGVGDMEGRLLECNVQLARMLGYPVEELVGMHISGFSHPDDWAAEVPLVRELRKGVRTTIQLEKRYRRKDGGRVWGRLSASVVANAQGEPQLVIGVVENITDRKNALDQLRQSEERYRLIADNATDMIWTARAEGINELPEQMDAGAAAQVAEGLMGRWQFTYISPAVRRLFGYDADEAVALRLEELLTGESYQRAIQVLAEELAVEQQQSRDPHRQRVVELQHVAKDGSVKWCEVTTTFLRNGEDGIAGILGVTRDITGRREAEAALRKSESTLRGLFENMPDSLVVVNRQGVIQYVNRRVENQPREALMGKDGFSLVSPEDRERCLGALNQAYDSMEVQHVDGVNALGRLWSSRMVPVVEDGKVQTVMVISTDITEQKKAEEAIRKEQELLRQMLDLHERDRELLAFELHDGFVQLLAGAMMAFQAAAQLQQAIPQQAEGYFQKGIRLLRESIDESRRLISGLRPPVLEEFGILAAVEHLVSESQSLGGQQIQFISKGRFQRLARPLESAIFRIVQETLTNARTHSQSDRVRLELSRQNDRICITVQDWGVGFDPGQVSERCFGIKGIRQRARLLGGQTEIRTAPGAGTCVTVRLPLVPRAQNATDEAGQQADTTSPSGEPPEPHAD